MDVEGDWVGVDVAGASVGNAGTPSHVDGHFPLKLTAASHAPQ